MQYTIDTTPDQDKLIQAYCDAKPAPLDAQGQPLPKITPVELVGAALKVAIINIADTAKFGVAHIVSNKYDSADDEKKSQVDAILGVKAAQAEAVSQKAEENII